MAHPGDLQNDAARLFIRLLSTRDGAASHHRMLALPRRPYTPPPRLLRHHRTRRASDHRRLTRKKTKCTAGGAIGIGISPIYHKQAAPTKYGTSANCERRRAALRSLPYTMNLITQRSL